MGVLFQREENKTGEIIINGVLDRSDVLKRIEEGTFSSVLVHDNGMLKSIILNLVLHEIPFTKVSCGSGIYRVMKEEKMEKTCSKK